MSPHDYATNFRLIAEEIADELEESEVDVLRELLVDMGSKNYYAWRDTNVSLVASFVASSPSARRKKKIGQSDRLLLTISAYHSCNEAADFLLAVSFLPQGGSYRKAAAESVFAVNHYEKKREKEWFFWPFPDPDPFVDSDFFQR